MCIFCKTNGDLVVKESRNSLILINCFPMGKMSLVAIPKRHVKSISELREDERNDFFELITSAQIRLKLMLEPEGINTFINEGEVAGQNVDHLHCHIILRGKNDGLKNFIRIKEKKIITPTEVQKIKKLFGKK